MKNLYNKYGDYQSRPPHGGRGLKSLFLIGIAIFAVVALPTEGVD